MDLYFSFETLAELKTLFQYLRLTGLSLSHRINTAVKARWQPEGLSEAYTPFLNMFTTNPV